MNSNKNKQILWKLLYDKKCFAKFQNNQFDKIKQIFDTLIIKVNEKSNDTLLIKNKEFIQLFIEHLNKIEPAYTREDIINARTEDLLNNYNKKTDEFNTFKSTRPAEIDFSDTIKETPIDLLNATSKLIQTRDDDIPILQQMLTILKEINSNQKEILDKINQINQTDILIEDN